MIEKIVDKIIKDMLEEADKYIEQYIEPIGKVGSPEKVLGKEYKNWTPQDFQMMSQVYGDDLNKFIFGKEYEEVKRMEQEA